MRVLTNEDKYPNEKNIQIACVIFVLVSITATLIEKFCYFHFFTKHSTTSVFFPFLRGQKKYIKIVYTLRILILLLLSSKDWFYIQCILNTQKS